MPDNATTVRVEHSLNEEEFTLVSESFPDEGPGAILRTRWNSEEEMNRNLASAMAGAEAHLTSLTEKTDEVYAGNRAATAKSKMTRVHLPFGYHVHVGVFTGHEYDEASLVLGHFKVIVGLKLTGGFYWKTLRVEREKGMIFGIGNASSAFFVGRLRRNQK